MIWILFILLAGCQDSTTTPRQKGEYIFRKSDQATTIPPLVKLERKPYFWEKSSQGIQEITKEYFRCKGDSLNPVKSEMVRGEVVKYHDCSARHSLPLKEGKESIYPILLELLNHVQAKLPARVVITSGHRCPEHNTYIDSSPHNQYSKHQIGAEVDFYVQGMESVPERILEIIFNYYKERYPDKKEYAEFKRYEKDDISLTVKPWMNKEVFIKLNKSHEGRNDDNRHPYPYISIQVRYDRDKNERVAYSWGEAFGNYHRY